VGFARTQLPCVHDLTWFTNSAEAADALNAFTHTHSPSATAQSAKANKRQHHTGTTTSTIGLTTDGSAQSEQSDDISNFETNDKHTLTIMKEMTAACRQNPLCAKLDPFDRVACIRRCVSPMCYNQIYDSSPLEPGEIDTKYPGYKSCFHKLWKSKYRESLNIT